METKNGFTFKRKGTSKIGNMSINISDKIGQEGSSECEFVFKRVSANKKVSLKNNKIMTLSKLESKYEKQKRPNSSSKLQKGIKSKISPKHHIENCEELDRAKLKACLENENFSNFEKNEEIVNRRTKSGKKKEPGKAKNDRENLVENSLLQFNIVKKRKTIHLDKSIDISSSSIVIDDRPVVDNCIKNNNFITNNDLSLNDNKLICNKENFNFEKLDFGKKNHDKVLEIDDIINNNPLSGFEQLQKEIRAEKIKSGEIYKKVNSNNINDLIKGCIGFLSTNTAYSNEIVKHCNLNFFSDIDYRREIEATNNKIEHFKAEIKKWKGIYEAQKAKNIDSFKIAGKAENSLEEIHSVDLNSDIIEIESSILETENDKNVEKSISKEHEPVITHSNKKVSKVIESSYINTLSNLNESLSREFEDKSKKLRSLDLKVKLFLENAKEKSESLLRNVFDSLDDRSGDAMFLLKAMSRLGR